MPDVVRSARPVHVVRSAWARSALSSVVLSLGVVAVACTAKGGAVAPEGPVDPPSVAPAVDIAEPVATASGQGFALVWFDAQLHRSPDDGAPLQAYDFANVPRERRPGQVFVVTRLESRGPWVKVGGVDAWTDEQWRSIHCIGSDIFAEQAVDVAVWVHERELAPVLKAPFELRHEDGTFVALTPGVPIIGDRPWVDGFLFPLSVPPGSIGRAYQPLPIEEESMTPSSNFTAAQASFKASLGGEPVPWSQPVWSYGERKMVALTGPIDGQRHLVARTCGSFELAVEGEFEAFPVGGVLGGMGSAGEPQAGGAVAAGTPLLWPDGTPAGSTIAELRRVDLAPRAGPMTCIELAVGRQLKTDRFRAEKAQVCVETSRIEAVEL